MDKVMMLQVLAASLFALGLTGVIIRRNVLVMLMCMELMLNGVNLSLATFAHTMGSAVGASYFFAYCHLNRGDVKVDFFTQHWSAAKVMSLDAIGSLLIGLFASVIAWRTTVGAISLREVGESSAILDWPMWIVRLAMVPGFVLMALAGFYMAVHFVRAARRGALS